MTTIMNILQTYEEIWKTGLAGILGIVVMILLAGILRQIKKLNGNLKSITSNMQAYFDVILAEEPEAGEEAETKKMEQTEEEIQAKIEQMKKQEEEEKLFHTVLQEYFS